MANLFVIEGRLVFFKHGADRTIVFIKYGAGCTIESQPKLFVGMFKLIVIQLYTIVYYTMQEYLLTIILHSLQAHFQR